MTPNSEIRKLLESQQLSCAETGSRHASARLLYGGQNMNPEVVPTSGRARDAVGPLFWGWDVALEMFFGGTAGALMLFSGVKRFDPGLQRTA